MSKDSGNEKGGVPVMGSGEGTGLIDAVGDRPGVVGNFGLRLDFDTEESEM